MSTSIPTGFVEEFMDLMNKRIIKSDTEYGEGMLLSMYMRLSSILEGDDPKVALQIKCKKGAQKKPYTLELALLIHGQKHYFGDSWATIEVVARDWLEDRGIPNIGLSGLKKLYARNKEDVEKAIQSRGLDKFLRRIPRE